MVLGIIGTMPSQQRPAQQQPAQQQNTQGNGQSQGAGNVGQPTSPDAVAPSKDASSSGDSKQSTSYSGSGAGAGGTASQTVRPAASLPPTATPKSVVDARTTDISSATITEDAARRAALNQMQIARQEALIENLKAPPEVQEINRPTEPETTPKTEPISLLPTRRSDDA